MSTLLHVDGTTVEQPLLQALGAGLHDVPLLLSSTQAEMNVMPIERMLGASREQLHEFWDEQFVPLYGRDMVRELRHHYRAYDPPEAAVYALDSDTGPACGLMHVALSAARAFTSPVYLATVEAAPSKPTGNSSFAYHCWDWDAASACWGSGYPAPMVPSEEDKQFGKMLLASWVAFVQHGRMDQDSGWHEVLARPGAQHYYHNVVKKGEVVAVRDHKTELCAWWQSQGVGQNWWWIN